MSPILLYRITKEQVEEVVNEIRWLAHQASAKLRCREISKEYYEGCADTCGRAITAVLRTLQQHAEEQQIPPPPEVKPAPPALFEGMTMAEGEREVIRRTLMAAGGNKTKASRILEMPLRTLYRKLELYGLDIYDTE